MPVDAKRYPSDWKETSRRIRFGRAKGTCEWPGCAARHGEPHPLTGSVVMLTTAHLPVDGFGCLHDVHDKMDCSDYSLLALCQMHHLRLDGAEHAKNAARTRWLRRAQSQPALSLEFAP